MGRHGTIRRSDESEQETTGHAGRRRAPRGPATIGAGADAARPGGVARRRLSHHRLLALLVARALHALSARGPKERLRDARCGMWVRNNATRVDRALPT